MLVILKEKLKYGFVTVSDETAVVLSEASDDEMQDDQEEDLEPRGVKRGINHESGSAGSDGTSSSSSDGGKEVGVNVFSSL